MEAYIVREITKKLKDKIYHKFFDESGSEIKDKKHIKQITEGIYIPPAYSNVKINKNKHQKVRAIGYDNKDRPQYIYNKEYIKQQSEKKFNHMAYFGKKFHKINHKINEDLYSVKDSKEKQIAMILKLIMECHFRVGSDRYYKENKSYGTTTLEKKHIKIKTGVVEIDFIGKKKVRNRCTIKNKKIIKNLKEKKRTLKKNDKIFSYRKGRHYYNIKSSDVNKYLKQFGKVTTKNFRTWGANIEFISQSLKLLKHAPKHLSKTQIKTIINDTIKYVCKKLHNTPSVCRSNYLDPELIKFLEYDCKKYKEHFMKNKDEINRDYIQKQYIQFLEDMI
tara:strand:- start:212 stop:1213 length:1002 start_codon:yes stop_codon:yes gene_type:complete